MEDLNDIQNRYLLKEMNFSLLETFPDVWEHKYGRHEKIPEGACVSLSWFSSPLHVYFGNQCSSLLYKGFKGDGNGRGIVAAVQWLCTCATILGKFLRRPLPINNVK